jgi:hypothetical protein
MTASGFRDIRTGTSSSSPEVIGLTSLSLGANGFRVGAITSEIAPWERASSKVRLPTNPVAPSSSNFIFGVSLPRILKKPSHRWCRFRAYTLLKRLAEKASFLKGTGFSPLRNKNQCGFNR